MGPVPNSWDICLNYCHVVQAKMFTPKDESEWNYLKQKASPLSVSGNFYMPINNREGNLIWNNGSCECCLNRMFLFKRELTSVCKHAHPRDLSSTCRVMSGVYDKPCVASTFNCFFDLGACGGWESHIHHHKDNCEI